MQEDCMSECVRVRRPISCSSTSASFEQRQRDWASLSTADYFSSLALWWSEQSGRQSSTPHPPKQMHRHVKVRLLPLSRSSTAAKADCNPSFVSQLQWVGQYFMELTLFKKRRRDRICLSIWGKLINRGLSAACEFAQAAQEVVSITSWKLWTWPNTWTLPTAEIKGGLGWCEARMCHRCTFECWSDAVQLASMFGKVWWPRHKQKCLLTRCTFNWSQ